MENWGEFANSSSSSYCFPYTHQLAGPATAPAGGVHHHLTCLKLGPKRGEANAGGAANKRERLIPTCQVEGCGKVLMGAKDYHRRHKVCEVHSKAPRVVVMGTQQRFCQQCSRFHAISEFDESKRSCRRRLAGHNERRRKNSCTNDSVTRIPTAAAPSLETTMICSRFPFLSQTSSGSACSLLSSKVSPWIPAHEYSSQSGAALRDLIAENRASLLAQHLFSNRGNRPIFSFTPYQNQDINTQDWNQLDEFGGHLTLDLLQSSNSSVFEFLSDRKKPKEDEEGCCQFWKSLEEGTRVV